MTNAQKLFEEIFASDPQKYLAKMVNDRVLESEYLDYKSADKITDDDTKKNWSKSLSAYANTGGGVVIWGVDCKKQLDKATNLDLDVPQGFALCDNCTHFAQRLSDWHLSATQDSVEGVKVRAIQFEGRESGCVVCYIPEGQNKPYRSMFTKDWYYLRAPDRMMSVSHALLRSLFQQRKSPKLEVTVNAYWTRQGHISDFDISIKNIGQASATHIFLVVRSSEPMLILEVQSDTFVVVKEVLAFGKKYQKTHFKSVEPLHPTLESKLCKLKWEPTQEQVFNNRELVFEFDLYIQDAESQFLEVNTFPHLLTGPRIHKAVPRT